MSNGLTVIINEDHRTPSVFGSIVVRTGSVDEPSDATGLAHYLEHMMFKGSTNVGTTNWSEEKEHYNKIIELYDQLGQVPEEGREAIQQKINEESLLAGQYTINNEFSNMIQAIGGTSLNAATGYDFTYYHNVFPSFQLKKWLELNADRFENPVFRGFQAELETVYEEKNMYSDNPYSVLFEEFSKNMYGDNNPYARSIVGLTEHLKTPSLRKLTEFYNTYYTPSNMALVLSGDVNVELAKNLIDLTLGKLKYKEPAKRNVYSDLSIESSRTVKTKLTPMPMLIIGYAGASASSVDGYKLEVLQGVLSNSNKTGLLDKLMLDGDIQSASVSLNSFRQSGMISFVGVPVYDRAQMRFGSLSKVKSNISKVVDQLKSGDIEDWLVQSVKDDLVMGGELSKESNLEYGMMLVNAFGNDVSIEDVEKYIENIKAVTKDDVVAMAQKYFGKACLTLESMTGEPKKDKISKPNYKPIVPATGKTSDFAANWLSEKVDVPAFKPIDFSKDFSKTELVPGVTLFHTENPDNNIFSLTIKFGVGSTVIPELDFCVSLMNRAGIMALYTPIELKKAFGQLGCVVNFYNDKSYTYVTMRGKESSLARACQLLSKSCLMPSIDEKQMNSLLGRELGQRSIESKDKDAQADALREYLKYGEQSSYINRLTNSEISQLTVSKLAAGFIKASQYEATVHYTGHYSSDVVKNILIKNLVFQSNLKASKSPVETPTLSYDKTTIYLLNNKNARQSDVFLFVQGDDYQLGQKVTYDAFNQYFGGGFNGLVLQELRELRSFAYTASANYSIPKVAGRKADFNGYIGTQGDKTVDAVSEFLSLIQDMPTHPERIDNIKEYLNQANLSASPSIRQRTMLVENWILSGYSKDPRVEWTSGYKNLTFGDVENFYNQKLKNKPIAVAIVANTKNIDKKKLDSLGKVVNIDVAKLFKY
ncbi:peptidase M16 [Tenuifilaceae bacterium CYCD]|nr:peptidase M16 [Tenuifilaceae bacterium CYCD]